MFGKTKKIIKLLKKKKARRKAFLIVMGAFFLTFLTAGGVIFFRNCKGKIYPHISVMGVDLSFKSRSGAMEKIEERANAIESKPIFLKKGNKVTAATLLETGVKLDRERMYQAAWETGRNEGLGGNLVGILENTFLGYEVPTYFQVDNEKVNLFIAKKLEILSETPHSSRLVYRDGKFMATPSKTGKGIDPLLFASQIVNYINDPEKSELKVPDEIEKKPDIEEFQTSDARQKANRILENVSKLTAGGKTWEIDKDTAANFLTFEKTPHFQFERTEPDPSGGDVFPFVYYSLSGITPHKVIGGYVLEVSVNLEEIKNYLVTVAPGIEQAAVNARVGFENDQLVIAEESQDKISLDIDKSAENLAKGLLEEQGLIELVVLQEKAPISRENLDELGIKTLIGEGVSNFSGSPRNRRHNIATGASKFDGSVIKPGETFSFLENLGPVDASTGYLPELVIKNNKTVPEYGGGMCQVSTTTFRGAVNSGFEVIERKNHAYPVQYYSPQGTDATVYIPSPDLKFINNTPAHVLIQTKIEGNILTFEFYGTDDGRRVETIGPVTYDRKPDGGMRAKWTQKVFRSDGNLMLEKTFLSKYDSPSKYPHPGEEESEEEKKKKDKKKKKH